MTGDLLAALAGGPKLDGANCVGMWTAFDPAEPGETAEETAYRHGAAIALCEACNALQECRDWSDSLPPGQRPRGIIAGRLHDPQPKRKKEIAT